MDSAADIEALRAALAAERTRSLQAEAELALARARNADDAATIALQLLEIAKLKRRIYGPRSERTARLIDQMELELEELEATATEDEIAAERAAAKTTTVAAFTRKRPSRQPFPAHLRPCEAWLRHDASASSFRPPPPATAAAAIACASSARRSPRRWR